MVLGGNDFGGFLLGSVALAARVSVTTGVSRVHRVQFGSSLVCLLRTSNAAMSTSRALLGGLGS